MTGAEAIAEERRRQIEEERWTAEHDAIHHNGDLTQAAICYANTARLQVKMVIRAIPVKTADNWPWELRWWKPSDHPVRNLVKAGALIAAEIDRILKAKEPRP